MYDLNNRKGHPFPPAIIMQIKQEPTQIKHPFFDEDPAQH